MSKVDIVLAIEELIDDEKRQWKQRVMELLRRKEDYYGKLAASSSVAVVADIIDLIERKL